MLSKKLKIKGNAEDILGPFLIGNDEDFLEEDIKNIIEYLCRASSYINSEFKKGWVEGKINDLWKIMLFVSYTLLEKKIKELPINK